ncbi:MAG: PKD domain-containing protein [Saprospiraceae bacterium]|nr:PKD domain-containing protein [Saprospiraceae bacterium]
MVMVNEKPIINIGADQRICQGDSVTLDAGAGQNYTYRWTRDNTNVGTAKTLIAKVTGLYVVTVTTGQGCSATDQMSLTVVPSLHWCFRQHLIFAERLLKSLCPPPMELNFNGTETMLF